MPRKGKRYHPNYIEFYQIAFKGGKIQLTDALKEIALKEDMYAYDFIGKRYDVGNNQVL